MADAPVVETKEAGLGGTRAATLIDMHVGRRIKSARLLLGLSQMELGQRLGLTFQQIQKYEKGVNRVGASRLFHMSRSLGVSIQFFFDGLAPDVLDDVPQHSNSDVDSFAHLTSREDIEVAKTFALIKVPAVRRALLAHIRAIASLDARMTPQGRD